MKGNMIATALVVLVIAAATAVTYSKTAAQEASVHGTIDAAENTYIETPSGHTRTYKFVDTDGTVCYIAESAENATASPSMVCDIRTPEQTQ